MRRARLSLLCIAFALAAASIDAQVQDRMLVSTAWLSTHWNSVAVVDVGDERSFAAGHLPAARLLKWDDIVVRRDGTPNELPGIAELEKVFTGLGVGDRTRIILYSRDPLLAARAWFTLDYLGQGARTAILDGGYGKWVADGYHVSLEPMPVVSRPFHSVVNADAVIRLTQMRNVVRWSDILYPAVVLIDARSQAQYCGEEAGAEVDRPGRIPGAVNVSWDENLVAGTSPVLRDPAALRDIYERAGVTEKTRNIVYCRTGVQASLTYFVLRYLGYDATLYDGSYVEWNRALNTLVVENPWEAGRAVR